MLCRAEDAGKYTSLEAINRPEVRVMENPGGLNEKFARESLPDATLIIHDINQEIPGLVASGEADVMITEIMEAGYYVGQDNRLAAPLIFEPFTRGQLGVLMPKGSDDLLDYVNAFLAAEKESGRIDELAEKYIYRYIRTDEELDKLLSTIRDEQIELIDLTFYGSRNFAKMMYESSDQHPFARAGIPAVLFTSAFHEHTYKKTDTPAIIDYPLLRKRTQVIFQFVNRLCAAN